MKRILLLAFAASALVAIPATASAQPDKVDVCHLNDDGTYTAMRLPEKAAAVHLSKHADGVPGDPAGLGQVLGADCAPVKAPALAIAYTDVAPLTASGMGPEDVLLAEIVDANGTGAIDAGDVYIGYVYPTAFDAPYGFAPIPQAAIELTSAGQSIGIAYGNDGETFVELWGNDNADRLLISKIGLDIDVQDAIAFDYDFGYHYEGQPFDEVLAISRLDETDDDAFIDVELLVTN